MTSNISDYTNQYENPLFFACGPIEQGFWRYFKDVEGQTDTQAITSVIKLILLIKEQIPYFRDIRYKNTSQYLENLKRDMPSIPSWIKMKVMRKCIDTAHDDPKNDKPFRIALKVLNLSPKQQYKCLKTLYEKVDPSLMDSSLAEVLDKEVLIQFAYDCLKESVKPRKRVQFWELYGVSSEERLEQLIDELNTREHKDLLERVRNWKSFGLTDQHAENFICEAFGILDIPYLEIMIADLASYEFTPTMLIALFTEFAHNDSRNFLQIDPAQLRDLGCSDEDLQDLFKESIYFLKESDFPLSEESLAKWNLSQEFIDRSLLICDELPRNQVIEIVENYLPSESLLVLSDLQKHPEMAPHLLPSIPNQDQALVLRLLGVASFLKVSHQLLLIALQTESPIWLKEEFLSRFNPFEEQPQLDLVLPIVVQSVSKNDAVKFCYDCFVNSDPSQCERLLETLRGTEVLFDLCLSLSEQDIDLNIMIQMMPQFSFSSDQCFEIWKNLILHRERYVFKPYYFLPILTLPLTSPQLFELFDTICHEISQHYRVDFLQLAFSSSLDESARIQLLKQCFKLDDAFFSRLAGSFELSTTPFLSKQEYGQCYLELAKSGRFISIHHRYIRFIHKHMKKITQEFSTEFHLQFLVAIFSKSTIYELTSKDAKILWSYPQFDALRGKALELLLWMPLFDTRLIPLLQA